MNPDNQISSRSAARKWMEGEISIGKLLGEFGVPRPAGDDLLGHLWQAWSEQANALKADLERRLARAEKSLEEAHTEKHQQNIDAESASKLAYSTALSDLQMRLFGALEKINQESKE